MQAAECLKAVLNHRYGIESLVTKHAEIVDKLVTLLTSKTILLKKLVWEVLSALCLYSPKGYTIVLKAFSHFRVNRARRYRFSVVMEELARVDIPAFYVSATLGFVNCLMFSTKKVDDRFSLRSEFIGLGLLDHLHKLETESLGDDVDVQVSSFLKMYNDDMENAHYKETQLTDTRSLFGTVFQKIQGKPEAESLCSMLQALLMLDDHSEYVWEACESVVQSLVMVAQTKDHPPTVTTLREHLVREEKKSIAAMKSRVEKMRLVPQTLTPGAHGTRLSVDGHDGAPSFSRSTSEIGRSASPDPFMMIDLALSSATPVKTSLFSRSATSVPHDDKIAREIDFSFAKKVAGANLTVDSFAKHARAASPSPHSRQGNDVPSIVFNDADPTPTMLIPVPAVTGETR